MSGEMALATRRIFPPFSVVRIIPSETALRRDHLAGLKAAITIFLQVVIALGPRLRNLRAGTILHPSNPLSERRSPFFRERRGTLALLVLAAAALSCGGCRRALDAGRAREEVIAREKASFDAWQRKDKAFYEEYWSDAMTEFLPDNPRLVTKAETMPKFEQIVDHWKLNSLEMIDPDVRVYGDIAILTYREAVSGSAAGQASQYTGKVTMIYVREGERWRGVHYHESKNEPSN